MNHDGIVSRSQAHVDVQGKIDPSLDVSKSPLSCVGVEFVNVTATVFAL